MNKEVEKDLLIEMLEEEELLLKKHKEKLKKISPKKKHGIKKNKPIPFVMNGVIKEAKKKYSVDDETEVKKLLSRNYENNVEEDEEEYSPRLNTGDKQHRRELREALHKYRRVHLFRLIKITIILLFFLAALFYYFNNSNLTEFAGINFSYLG